MRFADVELDQQVARGIHAKLGALTSDGGLVDLIEIVTATEINAMAHDYTQDIISYDSQVQCFSA